MVRVGYTRVGFALGMYISCCWCQFHSCWVANVNAISSGIWALKSRNFFSILRKKEEDFKRGNYSCPLPFTLLVFNILYNFLE